MEKENGQQFKGTLVYDGNCEFCQLCALMLKQGVEDRVEVVPYQSNLARFPGLTKEQYVQAVQWIGVDGVMCDGMYAVYTCLMYWDSWWVSGLGKMLCHWYEHIALFRKYSDWKYRWIANHRPLMKYMFELVLGDTKLMRGDTSGSWKFFYWVRRIIGIKVVFVYGMSMLGLFEFFKHKHFDLGKFVMEGTLMSVGLFCGLQMIMNPPRFLRYFFLGILIAFFVTIRFWW